MSESIVHSMLGEPHATCPKVSVAISRRSSGPEKRFGGASLRLRLRSPEALLASVAIISTASIPFGGETAMVLALALVITAILTFAFSRSLAFAGTVWFLVAALVPPWIYLSAMGARIAPLAIVSVAILAATVGRVPLRWNVVDTVVILMLTSIVAASAFFDTPTHIVSQAVLEWGACYFTGRYLFKSPDFERSARVAGATLGLFAIAQFALRVNIAEVWPFSLSVGAVNWMGLQERAGMLRAELTFGQSIALGGVLCLLLPFILRSEPGMKRTLFAVAAIAGAILTLSRSTWISVAMVLITCIVLSRKLRGAQKWILSILSGAAIAVSGTVLGEVLSDAGTEVQMSTSYRESLTDLVQFVRPLGLAEGATPVGYGATFSWGEFYSIDNGLLFVALYAGAVAAACFALVYLVVSVGTLGGHRAAPGIAILCQLPFLLTVAPITQYQSVYWLMAGAAATAIWVSQPSKAATAGPTPGSGQAQPKRRALNFSNGSSAQIRGEHPIQQFDQSP